MSHESREKLAERVDLFRESSEPVARELRLPLSDVVTKHAMVVLHNPLAEGCDLLVCGDKEATAADLAAVASACRIACPEARVTIDMSPAPWYGETPWVKVAEPTRLRRMGELLNFFPGKYPGGIPNHPNPLAATLTGGAVGAGLGYGAGWLGEKLMPNTWRRGRLRGWLAGLGGAAGMTPGLAWTYANVANNKAITSGWPLNTPPYSASADGYAGDPAAGAPTPPGSIASQALDGLDKGAEESDPYFDALLEKLGSRAGGGSDGDLLAVDVDEFNRAIWHDGRVANALNPEVRGFASGLLTAAQSLPGGVGPGFVTPMQMGRLAAGMGAGYLSGALVGGALGALTGMPPETQDTLKRTGMYAGVVQAVLPKLFGH